MAEGPQEGMPEDVPRAPEQARKPYHPPRVTHFGDLKNVTLGGGGCGCGCSSCSSCTACTGCSGPTGS